MTREQMIDQAVRHALPRFGYLMGKMHRCRYSRQVQGEVLAQHTFTIALIRKWFRYIAAREQAR